MEKYCERLKMNMLGIGFFIRFYGVKYTIHMYTCSIPIGIYRYNGIQIMRKNLKKIHNTLQAIDSKQKKNRKNPF